MKHYLDNTPTETFLDRRSKDLKLISSMILDHSVTYVRYLIIEALQNRADYWRAENKHEMANKYDRLADSYINFNLVDSVKEL